MQLSQALRLSSAPIVAFVGAGGKTSAIFRVAQELSPALVTTSTHLGSWQTSMADTHFTWAQGSAMPEIETALGAGITLVTGELDEKTERFNRLNPDQLEKLRQLAGYHATPLLIEADGARQKPLKAPAEHEPAIPEFVDTVVVVAGLSGLDKTISDENVHRAERFSTLTGLGIGEIVTPAALVNLLIHPVGGLKNIPDGARRLALLNQADTAVLQSQGNEIAQALLSHYDAAILASLDPAISLLQAPVLVTKEKIAGIILAAGEATRFGQPKQLLDYHGKSFIRAVAETALSAGLAPVIVVSGANAELIEAQVADLQVTRTRNENWKQGQSSSIRAGVEALRRSPSAQKGWDAGGAVFLLADQPQVSVEVIRALVERHAQDLPAVLAPYVFDQRANPVLFDRITFQDLLSLSGDTGGRAIFSKFSPRYLNWYDKRLLLDVDTPDDYARLMANE